MARIRSIHPGVTTDEDLAECSRDARLCFIYLGMEADDAGLFEWKPVRLKMRLFPADDIDMDQMLAELVSANKVARFEINGKPYGAIRNFAKFQRPKSPKYIVDRTPAINDYIGLAEKISTKSGNEEPSPDPVPPDDGKVSAEGRKVGREEGNSEADASGGQAAEIPIVDPAKQLFDTGVAFMRKKGVAEKQARSVIGKLRSRLNGSSEEALWFVQQAIVQDVTEPVAYFEAMLRGTKQPVRSDLMNLFLGEIGEPAH